MSHRSIVEIAISASNLPLVGVVGRKANPIVHFYYKPPNETEYIFVDRTEALKNSQDPSYNSKLLFHVPISPTLTKNPGVVKFSIYDVDDVMTNSWCRVTPQDLLCEVSDVPLSLLIKSQTYHHALQFLMTPGPSASKDLTEHASRPLLVVHTTPAAKNVLSTRALLLSFNLLNFPCDFSEPLTLPLLKSSNSSTTHDASSSPGLGTPIPEGLSIVLLDVPPSPSLIVNDDKIRGVKKGQLPGVFTPRILCVSSPIADSTGTILQSRPISQTIAESLKTRLKELKSVEQDYMSTFQDDNIETPSTATDATETDATEQHIFQSWVVPPLLRLPILSSTFSTDWKVRLCVVPSSLAITATSTVSDNNFEQSILAETTLDLGHLLHGVWPQLPASDGPTTSNPDLNTGSFYDKDNSLNTSTQAGNGISMELSSPLQEASLVLPLHPAPALLRPLHDPSVVSAASSSVFSLNPLSPHTRTLLQQTFDIKVDDAQFTKPKSLLERKPKPSIVINAAIEPRVVSDTVRDALETVIKAEEEMSFFAPSGSNLVKDDSMFNLSASKSLHLTSFSDQRLSSSNSILTAPMLLAFETERRRRWAHWQAQSRASAASWSPCPPLVDAVSGALLPTDLWVFQVLFPRTVDEDVLQLMPPEVHASRFFLLHNDNANDGEDQDNFPQGVSNLHAQSNSNANTILGKKSPNGLNTSHINGNTSKLQISHSMKHAPGNLSLTQTGKHDSFFLASPLPQSSILEDGVNRNRSNSPTPYSDWANDQLAMIFQEREKRAASTSASKDDMLQTLNFDDDITAPIPGASRIRALASALDTLRFALDEGEPLSVSVASASLKDVLKNPLSTSMSTSMNVTNSTGLNISQTNVSDLSILAQQESDEVFKLLEETAQHLQKIAQKLCLISPRLHASCLRLMKRVGADSSASKHRKGLGLLQDPAIWDVLSIFHEAETLGVSNCTSIRRLRRIIRDAVETCTIFDQSSLDLDGVAADGSVSQGQDSSKPALNATGTSVKTSSQNLPAQPQNQEPTVLQNMVSFSGLFWILLSFAATCICLLAGYLIEDAFFSTKKTVLPDTNPLLVRLGGLFLSPYVTPYSILVLCGFFAISHMVYVFTGTPTDRPTHTPEPTTTLSNDNNDKNDSHPLSKSSIVFWKSLRAVEAALSPAILIPIASLCRRYGASNLTLSIFPYQWVCAVVAAFSAAGVIQAVFASTTTSHPTSTQTSAHGQFSRDRILERSSWSVFGEAVALGLGALNCYQLYQMHGADVLFAAFLMFVFSFTALALFAGKSAKIHSLARLTACFALLSLEFALHQIHQIPW